MTSYSSEKLAKALLQKGFVESDSHHRMFRLVVGGKKTSVQTKISHGESEFDEGMLSERRRQLGFENKRQFAEFIECPLTGEQYVQILIRIGRIQK